MHGSRKWIHALLALFLLQAIAAVQAQTVQDLDWQVGPTKAKVGDKATIDVPEGYAFLDRGETKKMMELTENLPGEEEYVIAPTDLRWFAVFEFSDVGYVKDDEKLDPDALLASMKEGMATSNEEKKKRGWSTMTTLGWKFEPRYDKTDRLLEWAFLFKEDGTGNQVANYNTRLLGRTGVMGVILVAGPEKLDTSAEDLKKVIAGYSFVPTERYSEYRSGDRVAEFGLAALIAGGAAAVATKKGAWTAIAAFLAGMWKLLVAGAIGLFAWIGKLVKKKS